MAAVNLLKKEVYELIAAGEVIERPASVVKELLENCVDAGADSVTVEIKNGGRTFIRVTDNGCGMSAEDVPTAFLRHATSKVMEQSDLDRITTLGFRGEALASICAVSKTQMLTKRRGDEFGTKYTIEAGVPVSTESVGCPDGTSVIVHDLFYNVPARLKFLKKDFAEANRIHELVGRLALSHPEIAFRFIKDNRPQIVTAGDGKLYSAIYSVLGREFASTLIPVHYSNGNTEVDGFVSKPLLSRGNRRSQIFFVNGRYIRSSICSEAVEEAYRNVIMTGKYPACVLKINIDPQIVDVNVHPAKTEVRFSDPRYVYNSLYFAVRETLMSKDTPTKMVLAAPKYYDESELYADPVQVPPEQLTIADAQQYENEQGNAAPAQEGEDLFLRSLGTPDWNGVLPKDSTEQIKQRFISQQPSNKQNSPLPDNEDKHTENHNGSHEENIADISPADVPDAYIPSYHTPPYDDNTDENSYTDFSGGRRGNAVSDFYKDPDDDLSDYKFIKSEDFQKKPVKQDAADNTAADDAAENAAKQEEKPMPVVVGELFKTYIVAQCGEEMLLIDKHAAHERYIFEQIKKDPKELSSQMLIDPITVTLSFDEYSALEQNIERTEELGFVINIDDPPNISVYGIPSVTDPEEIPELIEEIAGKLKYGGTNAVPQLYDDICHTIACKAAIKANDESSIQELQQLVNNIYGRDDIRYCPHGRPVMITMSKRDVEKQFKRIV